MSVIEAWSMSMTTPHVTSVRVNHQATGTPSATTTTTTARAMRRPADRLIGGGVANSPDLLLASIRETVYGRSLPLATRDLLIQRSSLGSLAGVIGASSMVVDELFSREAIAQWLNAGQPAGLVESA